MGRAGAVQNDTKVEAQELEVRQMIICRVEKENSNVSDA